MESNESVQWSVIIQKPVQRLLDSGRAVREEVKKLIDRTQWKNLVVAKSVSSFVTRLLGGAQDQVAYLPVGAQ